MASSSEEEEEEEAREKKVPVEDLGEMGGWEVSGEDRGGVIGRERDRLYLGEEGGDWDWDWVDMEACRRGLGRWWSTCGRGSGP